MEDIHQKQNIDLQGAMSKRSYFIHLSLLYLRLDLRINSLHQRPASTIVIE